MLKLSLVFLLAIVGCATAYKDPNYHRTQEYQKRPVLGMGKSSDLSQEEIKKLLESKIHLPEKISLAIIRLQSEGNNAVSLVDQEMSEDFYQKENWGKKVNVVIPVPSFFITGDISLKLLRETAALLQADMLLIVHSTSSSDWKFQWLLNDNTAKGQTNLEVLLLDTRTSAFPFSAIVSQTAEVSEVKKDYSKQELMGRAKFESQKKL